MYPCKTRGSLRLIERSTSAHRLPLGTFTRAQLKKIKFLFQLENLKVNI